VLAATADVADLAQQAPGCVARFGRGYGAGLVPDRPGPARPRPLCVGPRPTARSLLGVVADPAREVLDELRWHRPGRCRFSGGSGRVTASGAEYDGNERDSAAKTPATRRRAERNARMGWCTRGGGGEDACMVSGRSECRVRVTTSPHRAIEPHHEGEVWGRRQPYAS
jgi:hypothetical protein